VDGAEGTLFTGSQSKQQGTGLLMIWTVCRFGIRLSAISQSQRCECV
jgi:hypothetical protein